MDQKPMVEPLEEAGARLEDSGSTAETRPPDTQE